MFDQDDFHDGIFAARLVEPHVGSWRHRLRRRFSALYSARVGPGEWRMDPETLPAKW